MLNSPLNTAATQSDIEHVIGLVKPTHIVVSTAVSKLDAVQAAVKTLKSNKPKIFTTHGRVGSLPQVSGDGVREEERENFETNIVWGSFPWT